MTSQSTIRPTATTRRRSKGELVFDVSLVVGICYYLYVAQSYPPVGREIPTVVGVVALAAAVVQLIGWFVPGMWKLTHGVPGDESASRTAAAQAAHEYEGPSAEPEAPPAATPAPESAGPRNADVAVAMGWAAGFVGAILLVGYVVAVPVFFLAYFGARRAWRLAIVSAVIMGLLTRFLFESLLGIPLPGGLFF